MMKVLSKKQDIKISSSSRRQYMLEMGLAAFGKGLDKIKESAGTAKNQLNPAK